MSHVKGHARRTIHTPGYHIRSKYDLEGLREKMDGGHHREFDVELPLTSMIDMFSMLVMFLLVNFSSTGEVFFITRDLSLPKSMNGHALEDNPLLLVTRDSVIFDSQKVSDNPLHLEERDQNMPQLRTALKAIRAQEEKIHPGTPFKGAVNIQADEGTPVIYIKRAMTTLVEEGWTGISFATEKPDNKSGG